MSLSNFPCAACKLLRRKCSQECVFAPYFPPDQPQKFASVHKVYGASNVARLINDLDVAQRGDAVNSLVHDAEARLRDPIYGVVGQISTLLHRLKQINQDLYTAKKELSKYIGPSAMLPMLQHPGFIQPHTNNPTPPAVFPYNMQAPMLELPAGQTPGASQFVIRDQHHQQILEAQQLAAVAAARDGQEIFRTYEQQPQQSDQLVRLNTRFDTAGQQHQQILEAQQLAAVARDEQEIFRTYEQPPQQSDQLVRLNAGFDTAGQHHQQILEAQQLAAVAAARDEQELFRTYEQQPQQSDQHVRLNAGFDKAGQHHQQILEAQQLAVAAAMDEQEIFRIYEQQLQQSDQLVRLKAGFDTTTGQHHQQILEAQQLAAVAAAAARDEQEMFRTYEQQPQQSDQLVRLNAGFDTAGQVAASGFNQMAGLAISPSLDLGSYDNPYQIQQQPQDHSRHHHQIQSQDHSYHQNQILSQLLLEEQHLSQLLLEQQYLSQLLLEQQYLALQQQQDQPLAQPQVAPQQQQEQPLAQPQVAPQQQCRAGSKEGKSVGPSC